MTGPQANCLRVTADLARAQDTDTILELNTSVYGPKDILATRADFEWRHDKNPAGPALIPVIRDDQGRVVGFIWLVPIRLRLHCQDFRSANGTNLVIHPQNRNGLGYIKLLRRFEQAFREESISVHFSFISDEKYEQLRSLAPQTTWNIPLLFSPLLPSFRFQLRSNHFGKGLTVKTVDRFDKGFDKFWDQIKDKYPVMAIRDKAFLGWRFNQFSGRKYHVLVVYKADQMLGYTVLRCTSIKGVKTGLIMDLLIANESLGQAAAYCLMTEVQAYFRKQRILLSMALMVRATDEYNILRQAGYLRLPDALAPRVFHFAYFVHGNAGEDLDLSAQDWFITFADYESY